MLASYMWSRTIVPTMAMYLLSAADEYMPEEHRGENRDFSGAISRSSSTGSNGFAKATATRCAPRWTRSILFCVLFSGVLRAFRAA